MGKIGLLLKPTFMELQFDNLCLRKAAVNGF
jgi:hypothetical protein